MSQRCIGIKRRPFAQRHHSMTSENEARLRSVMTGNDGAVTIVSARLIMSRWTMSRFENVRCVIFGRRRVDSLQLRLSFRLPRSFFPFAHPFTLFPCPCILAVGAEGAVMPRLKAPNREFLSLNRALSWSSQTRRGFRSRLFFGHFPPFSPADFLGWKTRLLVARCASLKSHVPVFYSLGMSGIERHVSPRFPENAWSSNRSLAIERSYRKLFHKSPRTTRFSFIPFRDSVLPISSSKKNDRRRRDRDK